MVSLKRIKEWDDGRSRPKPVHGFEVYFNETTQILFCYAKKPSDGYLITGGQRSPYREAYFAVRHDTDYGHILQSYCLGNVSISDYTKFPERNFGAYKFQRDNQSNELYSLGAQETVLLADTIREIGTELKLTVGSENPDSLGDDYFVPLLDDMCEDRFDDLIICLNHDRNLPFKS